MKHIRSSYCVNRYSCTMARGSQCWMDTRAISKRSEYFRMCVVIHRRHSNNFHVLNELCRSKEIIEYCHCRCYCTKHRPVSSIKLQVCNEFEAFLHIYPIDSLCSYQHRPKLLLENYDRQQWRSVEKKMECKLRSDSSLVIFRFFFCWLWVVTLYLYWLHCLILKWRMPCYGVSLLYLAGAFLPWP